MTTLADAWQAGIDAVVADNTLNRGGFADALRTVITAAFSNAEATALIDAIAAEFQRLGQINNPTWNNLRGNIINDPLIHRQLFDALGVTINQLPEAGVANQAASLIDLRADRDAVVAGLDRLDEIIAAEPNSPFSKLVKDVQRQGKDSLRGYKEQLRDQIRNITGDPDS